MKFRVIREKTASGAYSPIYVIEQESGQGVGWINRYLDREYVRRLANKSLYSYAHSLLHFVRWWESVHHTGDIFAADLTQSALLDYPFHSGVVNWVHIFSPSLVNQGRAGISRIEWYTGAPTDLSGRFGMSGDRNLGIPFDQPFPGFSLVNVSSPENNVGTAAIVTNFVDNDFNYGDDLIWEHGKHITKFGVQITRYQQNTYYAGNAGAMG